MHTKCEKHENNTERNILINNAMAVGTKVGNNFACRMKLLHINYIPQLRRLAIVCITALLSIHALQVLTDLPFFLFMMNGLCQISIP